MYVNPRRLLRRTDVRINADAKYMETQPPINRPYVVLLVDKVEIDPKHKKMFAVKEEPQPTRRAIKSVKQFLGPVVSVSPEPTHREEPDETLAPPASPTALEVIPKIDFRVKGV